MRYLLVSKPSMHQAVEMIDHDFDPAGAQTDDAARSAAKEYIEKGYPHVRDTQPFELLRVESVETFSC